jgi:hypothetical protein
MRTVVFNMFKVINFPLYAALADATVFFLIFLMISPLTHKSYGDELLNFQLRGCFMPKKHDDISF